MKLKFEFTAKVFTKLFVAFVSIYSLRFLTSLMTINEYNIYYFYFTNSLLLSSIFSTLFNQSIIRYFKLEEFRSLLKIMILSMFAYYISLLLFDLFFFEIMSIQTGFFMVLYSFYLIFDSVFHKLSRFKFYNIIEFCFAISRFFPFIILLTIYNSFDAIFLSMNLILLSINILSVIVLLHKNSIDSKNEKLNFNAYIKYGLPLVLLSIINWSLTYIDKFIFISFKLESNNSYIVLHSALYGLLNVIILTLITISHVKLIKLASIGSFESKNYLFFIKKIYNITFTILSILIFVFSRLMFSYFQLGYNIFSLFQLIIIISGIYFYGLGMIEHKFYEINSNTSKILLLKSRSLIVYVFVLFVFIGFGLIEFIPIASLTGYLSYYLFIRFSFRKEFRINPIPVKQNIIQLFLVLFSILSYAKNFYVDSLIILSLLYFVVNNFQNLSNFFLFNKINV